MRWPGRSAFRPDAFKAVLDGAARSFRQHGFTDIVLIGDHGGYQTCSPPWPRSSTATGPARPRAPTSWPPTTMPHRHPSPSHCAPPASTIRKIGTHAGSADTALMLATDASLVQAEQFAAAAQGAAGQWRHRGSARRHRRAWPAGHSGDRAGDRDRVACIEGRSPLTPIKPAMPARPGGPLSITQNPMMKRTLRDATFASIVLAATAAVAQVPAKVAAKAPPGVQTVPGMPGVPDAANLYSETAAGKFSPSVAGALPRNLRAEPFGADRDGDRPAEDARGRQVPGRHQPRSTSCRRGT